MAGILRHVRNEGCSQGVGAKLAELWHELRLNLLSFVGVGDKREGRGSIEQPKPEEDEAFDDWRLSIE